MSTIDDDDDEDDEEKPKNPIYSFIKYSILSICIMATAYRIYLNYQTYIEYKVLINSKVNLSESEALPQLSICFYEILSEDKLSKLNKSLMDEYHSLIDDPSRYNKWKTKNFSLKDLFDLSFNYEQYFQNCTFLDKDAINELNCSTFYTVTLSTSKKCFNFFHRNTTEENDKEWTYNRILLQNRPWVRIFVKKEFLKHKKKMDVVINPSFSLPNTDKSNPGYKSYTTDYTQSIFVSYDCRQSIRLEEPYETACQNYTKLGYFDRAHCVYECKAANFAYRNGGWTEDLTVNYSFADLIKNLNLTFNYTTDLVNDCETDKLKCSHLDCNSKEYRIINKYHKLDVKSISDEIEVRLYLNSAPTSSLEYEALTPLSNSFVSMFIGPASLWLGLSIYSLSKLVFWFLCEVTNRKKRKKIVEEDTNIEKMVDDKNHKTDYQTNYRPFILDPNNNQINDSKLINKSIDNYYNQLNRDSRFNSPASFGSPNRYNSSFSRLTNPLMVYKAGLELYPKKPLKIKKPNEENANKDKNTTSIEIDLDKPDDKNRWLSKLARQKNKLINSLFRSNPKVYPNVES